MAVQSQAASRTATASAGSGISKRVSRTAAIKGVDSKLASLILDEIVDGGVSVSFDDIAGLQVGGVRSCSTRI